MTERSLSLLFLLFFCLQSSLNSFAPYRHCLAMLFYFFCHLHTQSHSFKHTNTHSHKSEQNTNKKEEKKSINSNQLTVHSFRKIIFDPSPSQKQPSLTFLEREREGNCNKERIGSPDEEMLAGFLIIVAVSCLPGTNNLQIW